MGKEGGSGGGGTGERGEEENKWEGDGVMFELFEWKKQPQLFPEPAQLAWAVDTKHTPSYAPHYLLSPGFLFLQQGNAFFSRPFPKQTLTVAMQIKKQNPEGAAAASAGSHTSCCNQMGASIPEKGETLKFGILWITELLRWGWEDCLWKRLPLDAGPFIIENKLWDSFIISFSARRRWDQVVVLQVPSESL